MIKSLWLLLLGAAFLFACDPSRVFEENQDLEGDAWVKDHRVSFEFQVDDADMRYHIYANLRNAQNYPFQNLYYQYTLADSVGAVLEEELKNIQLFDPKTGQPYGEGLGDLFDHRQLLLEDYDFPQRGSYSITFEQYMRRDTLPLILSVGARVERVEESQ